ncbi:unnamed protein product [Heligmosomoides polygyrus]|uniref:Aquaporin n=1 Tax=Heligmosomoides polygyrus TaxID=6339 RepID=A0A183GJ62_HELPZ|nr:unnamed protein product [Heligmosomoides polygyrus]
MSVPEADSGNLYELYVQPALAEMIGTALFTLFVNLASAPSSARACTYSVISGLSLYTVRTFIGKVTRGHLNPGVTISQLLVRRIDVVCTIAFVVVQFFGAFLGAVLFRALESFTIPAQF